MRDVFTIAAESHIAHPEPLQSATEHEGVVESILNALEKGGIEECVCIVDRFPDLRGVRSVMGFFLADAMKSFYAAEIIRLIDIGLFAAVPTLDLPRLNVWTYALRNNRVDVMRELWSHRGKYPIDPNTLTEALSYATRERYRSDMVAWLVEAGADINSVASEHRFKYVHPLTFALHDALNVGTEQTVRALLNLGANPNHRDSEGGVPLLWAACYGDVSKVRALLSHGAYAPDETEDAEFWNALELAPEDCVEEIRRSYRSRQLGQMLKEVMGEDPDSSGGMSGDPGPL